LHGRTRQVTANIGGRSEATTSVTIKRVSQVRILPGAPILAIGYVDPVDEGVHDAAEDFGTAVVDGGLDVGADGVQDAYVG
jgi:hypothetical protein